MVEITASMTSGLESDLYVDIYYIEVFQDKAPHESS